MNLEKMIQRTSFEMFRDWSKVALKKYPNMDFTIIDETVLVNDTKKCTASALQCLFSEEYYEKRNDQDWCIGFVKGYIRGSIGAKWSHDYYQKQTDNYRYMIAVKSIIEFFKVDPDLSWRLDAIYKLFFKSCNLENIELNTQIDLDYLEKFDLSTTTPHNGIVKQALNIISAFFAQRMIDESSIKLPDKTYFSTDEILLLFQNKHEIESKWQS